SVLQEGIRLAARIRGEGGSGEALHVPAVLVRRELLFPGEETGGRGEGTIAVRFYSRSPCKTKRVGCVSPCETTYEEEGSHEAFHPFASRAWVRGRVRRRRSRAAAARHPQDAGDLAF